MQEDTGLNQEQIREGNLSPEPRIQTNNIVEPPEENFNLAEKRNVQKPITQVAIKEDEAEDQYRLFLQNSLSQIDDRFESEADEKSQSFIFLAQEYDMSEHP